ncbi:hypothetical protein SEA_KELA_213 [Streptomyces phage Kela]|nr:hypothetical protein SEA_JUSTBECAUSE_215 [Streptomyces phage JustBecause]QJD53773.1 hypothetical protein SEA_KELA_213 [Streptomyces phage Kela]
MNGPASIVMYLEKGSSKELFTERMTYDGAHEKARELASKGYEVIAVLDADHAAERQAVLKPEGGLAEGAHLHSFLGDTVRRFRQDYPGVPRESALEVISLLCTLVLEGESDLQSALLDEIHAPGPIGRADWRQHMRTAIANRRPDGAS